MKNDLLLTAKTVRATLGGVTGMTLYRWVKRGLLPSPVKINGRNYWREADVRSLFSQRGRGGEQVTK